MADLKFVEMMQSARIIVEDCLKLKPEEEVLVVTDTRVTDYFGTEALLTAVIGAIKSVGAEPNLITYTARTCDGAEIPKVVGTAMKHADVIITLPTFGLSHSSATREALASGARILMLPCGADIGRTSDMIYRMMPRDKKEIDDLARLTLKLGDSFANGNNVRLTTKLGTDLRLKVGELKMFFNTGICDKPGMLQYMPTGQLAIGVNPGSANGKIVADASIVPISRPLAQPIHFTVKDGYITSIDGESDAHIFKSIVDEIQNNDACNIAEVGLGTNPKAMVKGDPLEDERVYGSAHIGIGANATFGGRIEIGGWHSDAVILNATMEIDGKTIVEDGIYKI